MDVYFAKMEEITVEKFDEILSNKWMKVLQKNLNLFINFDEIFIDKNCEKCLHKWMKFL